MAMMRCRSRRSSKSSTVAPVWTCNVLRDKILDQIEELSRAGGTVRGIADELNLAKSKVQRLLTKLREEGRL